MHIEAWSIGDMAPAGLEGRRLAWTPCWVKSDPADNHYAHPIRGLHAIVDLQAMEVVKLEDHGVTPLPPQPGNYAEADVGGYRDDLRPLEVVQPEGPSFEVDGWEVRWQKWRLRVGFSQREGLTLHDVGYEDGGRVRPVAHSLSIAELVIPYGDPGPGGYRKNAFDIGEYGLGLLTNSLELGCDCLGEIRYLDVDLATPGGEVTTIKNAICLHEEDDGLLWKHYDWTTETTEVRRSRRFVVSSIVTVDNYEYAFYWRFYQDGAIEFETRLTGIILTAALEPDEAPRHGTLIAPQLSGIYHQHFFCARLDLDVDGAENTVVEVESEALPWGPENPHGSAFVIRETPLTREQEAQRLVDPLSARSWKVVNPRCAQRARPAGRLPARAGLERPAVRPAGLEHRPPGRVHDEASVGDALRRRRALSGGRLPEPAFRRRRPAGVDCGRPSRGGPRRRPLVRVRQPPRPAPGGLARHARRADRVPSRAGRVLRPQPLARRRRLRQATPATRTTLPDGLGSLEGGVRLDRIAQAQGLGPACQVERQPLRPPHDRPGGEVGDRQAAEHGAVVGDEPLQRVERSFRARGRLLDRGRVAVLPFPAAGLSVAVEEGSPFEREQPRPHLRRPGVERRVHGSTLARGERIQVVPLFPVGEVAQDRVRLGQDEIVVDQRRNTAERVEGEILRRSRLREGNVASLVRRGSSSASRNLAFSAFDEAGWS